MASSDSPLPDLKNLQKSCLETYLLLGGQGMDFFFFKDFTS